MIKTAVLKLENGRTLTIEAKDQGDKNVYVKRITINGQTLKRNYITHSEIMGGSKIIFFMDNNPNR